MYGFKKGDGMLNDCDVVTYRCPQERIDLLEGRKHGHDEFVITVAKTPDGHFLAGISIQLGNGGMCYAPSLSGKAYRTKAEAIRGTVEGVEQYITGHPQEALIRDHIKNYLDCTQPLQLELF